MQKKFRPHLSLLISIAALSIFFNCGGKKQVENDDRVFFTIDEGKLDLIYTDSSALFNIRIPKGLHALESVSTLNAAVNIIYDSLVLAIYKDSASRSAVIIKTIPEYPSFLNTIQNADDSTLISAGHWSEVHRSGFLHNHLRIHQLMLQNNDAVYIRLFFEHNNTGREIGFLTDKQWYNDALPGIESSIGSLSIQKQKITLNQK